MALWRRSVDQSSARDADAVYDELLARYSEPHRRYHTPHHVDHCLRQFDLAAGLMDDPDAVELAVWFHDVVYDPDASDNEMQSAELFLELAGEGSADALRRKVYDLIMTTIHRDPPDTLDQKYLVDIDLSSFGLPWPEMERDSVAVRDEFPDLPDEQFFPKQRKFLESLLARDTFCFTDFFQERHGEAARANITRHLAKVEGKGAR